MSHKKKARKRSARGAQRPVRESNKASHAAARPARKTGPTADENLMREGWRTVAEALMDRIPAALETAEAGHIAELRLISRFFKLPVKTMLQIQPTIVSLTTHVPRPERSTAQLTKATTEAEAIARGEELYDPSKPNLPPPAPKQSEQ